MQSFVMYFYVNSGGSCLSSGVSIQPIHEVFYFHCEFSHITVRGICPCVEVVYGNWPVVPRKVL